MPRVVWCLVLTPVLFGVGELSAGVGGRRNRRRGRPDGGRGFECGGTYAPDVQNASSSRQTAKHVEIARRCVISPYTDMSTPSPDHTLARGGSASFPALDGFDFDAEFDRAICGDDHAARGPASFEYLSTASPAGPPPSPPFPRRPVMMGDYTEKMSFLPSTSLVRNEVLEVFDVDVDDGATARDGNGGGRPVGFRCVHCRHAGGGRSGCAEFRPLVRMTCSRPRDVFDSSNAPLSTSTNG